MKKQRRLAVYRIASDPKWKRACFSFIIYIEKGRKEEQDEADRKNTAVL